MGETLDWLKGKAVGIAKDIAAKGTTVYNTNPPRGKSAHLDMPKLAQEQADRTLGKSKLSSPMTPASRKKSSK